MAAFRAEAREAIRAQVGKGRVICGLSGGVDSAVAAVLIHEAIGDQLTCVFVDHGLMRAGEGDEVVAAVPRPFQHPARPCRGGATVPRRARRRRRPREPSARPSAACSSRRSRREARKIAADGRGPVEFLAQGTLYPDVIEIGLVHRRPLGDDQVAPQCRRPARAHEHEAGRAVARTVQGRGARARAANSACREAFVGRHPFPGPGPRDPHPRRDHAARSSTSCARPTRSISRKSAPPASTTRSGRPSPCCCRCAPSA